MVQTPETMRCLVLVFALFFCVSCEERVKKEMLVIFENQTGLSFSVRAYPDPDYASHDLYYQSDVKSGMQKATFDLEPGEARTLFYSRNINQEPSVLLAKVFKGFRLQVASDDQDYLIDLERESAGGYALNPFTDSAAWIYEVRSSERPTNFRRNPVEEHCYRFVIEEKHLTGR